MWKRRWLILCLLTGNILLVGTVSATFMYNTATMTRLMQREMARLQVDYNTFPARLEFNYPFNQMAEHTRVPGYIANRDRWLPMVLEDVGIPVYRQLNIYNMGRWTFSPVPARDSAPRIRAPHLLGIEGFYSLINITHGRLPEPQLINGNIIEAIASDIALANLDMLLGETLIATDVHVDSDIELFINIVGIYEIAEGSELVWTTLRTAHNITLLIDPQIVHDRFIPYYHWDYRLTARRLFALDFNAMTSTQTDHYLQMLAYWTGQFGASLTENISATIYRHTEQANQLSITLLVLQLPMFIMLALFIYMVSRQILALEQNDISVIKSRGAGRGQILGLYIMQGLIIAAMALPVGLVLGAGICRMLGAANGFMELVARAPLAIELTPLVFITSGVALFFAFLVMLVPVIRFSKVTIVSHKRTKSELPKKPLWQRYFLDILLLGASIYVAWNFTRFGDAMADLATAERSFDPLLLMGSSMFIIGAGLFCLRIFPFIVRGIYLLGKRFWSPSVYASFIKVIRSAGEEGFIMIFLVFTLAVGIFSAQSARTLNLNYDHEIRYNIGADIVFAERWRDNTGTNPATGMRELPEGRTHLYTEPSVERFANFSEVEAFTRVMRRSVPILSRGVSVDVNLMAIETNTFGETIWFRDDLLQIHINYYLNALAARSDGVILSANMREFGLEVGDVFRVTQDHPFRPTIHTPLVIIGFVEHWPSFNATTLRRGAPGTYFEEVQFLAVANLAYITSAWGVHPYQIWINTNGASGSFFYEFVTTNRIAHTVLYSAPSSLVQMRNSPIVQGTNGVLTINFLITLFICFSGFLIYWVLSIRSRVLQFGIFRAMGMTMGSIIRLLVNEQIFITLTALGIGAIVGEVAARLFVPIIQLSYSAATRSIPLLIVVEARDYTNLYIVMGAMIVLCLCILFGLVARMRVAQVLKLGED
jgi:putative ABC transport system permease protein